jgi:hypothetical protein
LTAAWLAAYFHTLSPAILYGTGGEGILSDALLHLKGVALIT